MQLLNLIEKWHKNRLRNHLIFWIFLSGAAIVINIIAGENIYEAFWTKMAYLPGQIMISYALAYWFLPMMLVEKKVFRGLFLLSLTTYMLCVFTRFSVIYGLETLLDSSASKDSIADILTNIYAIVGQYLLLLYSTPIFFLLFKLSKDILVNKRNVVLLRQQKVEAELSFLRSQLHPHFLFNTLNNIYSLVSRDAEKSKKPIHQLADIMEYLHQVDGQERVLLQDEISLLQNYVELESLRYGDRLKKTIQYDLKHKHISIAPLILLTFVENAFKHGVSNTVDEAYLKISIHADKKIIVIIENSVENSIGTDAANYRMGIGKTNALRQLDLHYKDQYSYSVKQDNMYSIELIIPIE